MKRLKLFFPLPDVHDHYREKVSSWKNWDLDTPKKTLDQLVTTMLEVSLHGWPKCKHKNQYILAIK